MPRLQFMRRRIAPLADDCQNGQAVIWFYLPSFIVVFKQNWDEYSMFVPYRHRFPLLMVSPGRDHLAGAGRSGPGGSPETKRLVVHSGMVDQRLEPSPHIYERLLLKQ